MPSKLDFYSQMADHTAKQVRKATFSKKRNAAVQSDWRELGWERG